MSGRVDQHVFHVLVLAQQHFSSLRPTPGSPPLFPSHVQLLQYHIFYLPCVFNLGCCIMLTVRPANDPSLQALLQPLFLLDRQLQQAASIVESLKDLEDEIENLNVPNVLPSLRRCIHWMERGINEMQLYRLLLLYQFQRALQHSFQQHQRPPLMDLDFH